MPLPAIEEYEFGPYRMDTGERLLHRGEELVSLPPKVVGTLLVLVQNAGRMVDKNDLIKAVWPDTFVEEGALTRNISCCARPSVTRETTRPISKRSPSEVTGSWRRSLGGVRRPAPRLDSTTHHRAATNARAAHHSLAGRPARANGWLRGSSW